MNKSPCLVSGAAVVASVVSVFRLSAGTRLPVLGSVTNAGSSFAPVVPVSNLALAPCTIPSGLPPKAPHTMLANASVPTSFTTDLSIPISDAKPSANSSTPC